MSKKLVFCADGTWDDPDSNSNVCKLYTALENLPGVQLPMYDSGVGTDGTPVEKVLGGAIGAGLFQKIKDGYSALSAQYEPGDQVFIFGFSRGAYTARCLAGMISICGLPTINQTDSQCLDMAFEAYRNPSQRQLLLESLSAAYKMDNARIQLLGVWDTVGSLGIPALFGSIDVIQYGFLSTTVHENVVTAVQALSIDERRLQFQPALFAPSTYPNQTIVQAWFSGVHCDVGGGYPADSNGASPSNIPLLWMASYAKAAGLDFKPGALSNAVLALDATSAIHESRNGAYRIFPPYVRSVPADSWVVSSVKARCGVPDPSYAPENLHFAAGQLAGTYSLVDVGTILI